MLGINLKHCTVFTIRRIMILIMARVTLELSLPRRAVSTSGESQKVTGVMNVSRQRLLFSICRDPGRGRTTIKMLKKERAIENKWEQFVSTKVSLTPIYSFYFHYHCTLMCYYFINYIFSIFCLFVFTLYSQKYVDTPVRLPRGVKAAVAAH